MKKAEILANLNANKQALHRLEVRLSGGFGVDEGEEMVNKQTSLIEERDKLMHDLTALHSAGIFALNRTFSINPNRPTDSRQQCAAIAKTMTDDLLEHYHRDDIKIDAYNNALVAINHQLKILNSATTPDEFRRVTTEDVAKAITETLSRPSSSLSY